MIDILSKFDPITLEQMSSVKLMNRTDTKFVTNLDKLHQLLEMAQADYFVQDIDGGRNLEYDTTYWDEVTDGGYVNGNYPLLTGDYIQLIFLGNLRIPFCTIRRAYPPSEIDYYEHSVGELFNVEVRA